MNDLPKLHELDDCPGEDSAAKLKVYINLIYGIYLQTVVRGGLRFRGLSVNCQFRPVTFGKHYAFWHMMQEGKIEDDRTIDFDRCRRIEWISWVIRNAFHDARIRVFQQTPRGGETSWVLWLYEYDYAVILRERSDYFLLKTAFLVVRKSKKDEFERDWKTFQDKNG